MSAWISSRVGQMSFRYTGLPSLPLPSGSCSRSLSTVPAMRVGDHQRRAKRGIGAQVRVDARLEVAVAREHGGAHQIVLDDRLLDGGVERAGVADAGGAAVGRRRRSRASPGKAAGRAFRYSVTTREPGASEVFTCLATVRPRDRLLGQQARGEQHARVGGVGARGDGRDQHVAVPDVDAVLRLERACRGPRASWRSRSAAGGRVQLGELGLDLADLDAVLRALGARERGASRWRGRARAPRCSRCRPSSACRTCPAP